MRRIILLTLLTGCHEAEPAPRDNLAFLDGEWTRDDENGEVIERMTFARDGTFSSTSYRYYDTDDGIIPVEEISVGRFSADQARVTIDATFHTVEGGVPSSSIDFTTGFTYYANQDVLVRGAFQLVEETIWDDGDVERDYRAEIGRSVTTLELTDEGWGELHYAAWHEPPPLFAECVGYFAVSDAVFPMYCSTIEAWFEWIDGEVVARQNVGFNHVWNIYAVTALDTADKFDRVPPQID